MQRSYELRPDRSSCHKKVCVPIEHQAHGGPKTCFQVANDGHEVCIRLISSCGALSLAVTERFLGKSETLEVFVWQK